MRNLNLLFNKSYYRELDPRKEKTKLDEAFDKVNRLIYQSQFVHHRDFVENGAAQQKFVMKTAYPGLLVGIGNSHGTGLSDEDVAAGFSFDYVSGQPYIPGSTVKGVLRSHFKDHPELLCAVLGMEPTQLNDLETQIFEGEDVFFDAVVYDGAYDINNNYLGFLIGSEYITPHPDPMQNPIPVHLIKVLPGVRFEFRFRLKNSENLSADDKKKLFWELLLHFGIGAKTNVGFGILLLDDEKAPGVPKKPAQNELSTSKQDNPNRKPQNKSSNPDLRICKCGARNWRTDPKTGKERWNWSQKICYQCKEKLE
jgi:CRISPR-associated protein Cmr6